MRIGPFIIVVAAMAGVMYLLFPDTGPVRPPSSQAVAPDSEVVAHQRVEWLRINLGLPFPETTDVLQWDRRTGRDSEVWALLRVDPAQVPDIKAALISYGEAPNRQWTVTRGGPGSADDLYPLARDRRPAWWLPSKLSDADVLVIARGSGIFAVLSAKTGLVYFLHWDV